MKKGILLLFWMLLTSSFSQAQITVNNVFAINPSEGDQNLAQVGLRYLKNPDALYIYMDDPDPLGKITGYLSIKSCVNLHLYISCDKEKLFFGSLALSTDNIDEYALLLNTWKQHILGTIQIHNLSLAEYGHSYEIVTKLRDLTGVPVEILGTY